MYTMLQKKKKERLTYSWRAVIPLFTEPRDLGCRFTLDGPNLNETRELSPEKVSFKSGP